jgi:hypothetical protein
VLYSFANFRVDVLARVRLLNGRLDRPDAVWPGVLLLDVPDGLSAQAFELGDARAREELGQRILPAVIRENKARRFCWVMPVFREVGASRQECLLLVLGERAHVEAALAEVMRSPGRPPRLGRFSFGPYGASSRRVSGKFVERLLAAFEG